MLIDGRNPTIYSGAKDKSAYTQCYTIPVGNACTTFDVKMHWNAYFDDDFSVNLRMVTVYVLGVDTGAHVIGDGNDDPTTVAHVNILPNGHVMVGNTDAGIWPDLLY